jgi:murein DD-endopeptidase MepM/ murein hydrolase activator NlpD
MLRHCTRSIFAALIFLPLLAHALPQASSVPGGVAILPLGNAGAKPQAWLGERPVLVAADHGQWVAVVGLALDTHPGAIDLKTKVDGKTQELRFEVSDKKYPEQHITLKDKSKVDLSPADLARAEREIAEIKKLKLHWSDAPETDLDFIAPAQGGQGSRFGLRRFFNGEPRLPHAGMDVVVARGTPIKAVAAGKVLAAGDYFFNGKTLFIDHGNGLITMYCHLDRFDVKAGDTVAKGQQVALSGMTGRATGPHLHWSVILNGAMVDPALFIPPQPAQP